MQHTQVPPGRDHTIKATVMGSEGGSSLPPPTAWVDFLLVQWLPWQNCLQISLFSFYTRVNCKGNLVNVQVSHPACRGAVGITELKNLQSLAGTDTAPLPRDWEQRDNASRESFPHRMWSRWRGFSAFIKSPKQCFSETSIREMKKAWTVQLL